MTTLDELQRAEPEAVEYLRLRLADENGYINTPDIEAIHEILSERAELLATVGRLRGAALALYMAGHWSCDRPADEAALWTALRDALDLAPGTATRAALTTGEATTPNAGERG